MSSNITRDELTQTLAKKLKQACDIIENSTKRKIVDQIASRLNIAYDELMSREVSALKAMRDTLDATRPSFFLSGTQVGAPDARTSEREKLNNMNRDFMRKLRNREPV